MGKPAFSIGAIAPTPRLVDQYFNDSTGEGDHGEKSTPAARGTKASLGVSSKRRPSRTLQHCRPDGPASTPKVPSRTVSGPIEELLVDQLRDILHAEKQLVKALPKMAKAARSDAAAAPVRTRIWRRRRSQVERLNESLRILGAPARAKPCKGMAGLVEEGEEVMAEGKKKDDAPADLALIGAAQRVEHYEIAAYTTAQKPGAAAPPFRRSWSCSPCRWARSRTPTSCSTRWRSR